MTTYRTAEKLMQAQEHRLLRVKRSAESSTKEAAEISLKEAKLLTSGSVSAKNLRRANHPFARSRGQDRFTKRYGGVSASSAFPLLPVNQQSKRLTGGWRLFRYRRAGGVVYRVQNVSPHAAHVLRPGGTKNMVDRGFWPELSRRVTPKIRRLNRQRFLAASRG